MYICGQVSNFSIQKKYISQDALQMEDCHLKIGPSPLDQWMKLYLKCVWTICPSIINFVLPFSTLDLPSKILYYCNIINLGNFCHQEYFVIYTVYKKLEDKIFLCAK